MAPACLILFCPNAAQLPEFAAREIGSNYNSKNANLCKRTRRSTYRGQIKLQNIGGHFCKRMRRRTYQEGPPTLASILKHSLLSRNGTFAQIEPRTSNQTTNLRTLTLANIREAVRTRERRPLWRQLDPLSPVQMRDDRHNGCADKHADDQGRKIGDAAEALRNKLHGRQDKAPG